MALIYYHQEAMVVVYQCHTLLHSLTKLSSKCKLCGQMNWTESELVFHHCFSLLCSILTISLSPGSVNWLPVPLPGTSSTISWSIKILCISFCCYRTLLSSCTMLNSRILHMTLMVCNTLWLLWILVTESTYCTVTFLKKVCASDEFFHPESLLDFRTACGYEGNDA